MNQLYDILIIGSGPIASSTAYHLTKNNSHLKIALATDENFSDIPQHAAYYHAGGSVRMWWTDELMSEMTSETSDLIAKLVDENIDIGAAIDHYTLIHRGFDVPSWNITSKKLVAYFLKISKENGLTIFSDSKTESVSGGGGVVTIVTSSGTYHAKKVLVATGSNNTVLFPKAPFEYEKRALLVLDTPIVPEREHFPHLVVPLAEGVIFCFIKTIDGVSKFVLGQEDILEFNNTWEEENYYHLLVEKGLYTILPFLKDSQVEKVLWSFDFNKKYLETFEPSPSILVATCGSAVRSCAWIGRTLAEKLLK